MRTYNVYVYSIILILLWILLYEMTVLTYFMIILLPIYLYLLWIYFYCFESVYRKIVPIKFRVKIFFYNIVKWYVGTLSKQKLYQFTVILK